MGWSIGHDGHWERDIGYGVPAKCDYPSCDAEIDRGLAYVCGYEPYGGDRGCGLFFCGEHLNGESLCNRCVGGLEPYEPTPDIEQWINHKTTHPSWEAWRQEEEREENDLLSDGDYPTSGDFSIVLSNGTGKGEH